MTYYNWAGPTGQDPLSSLKTRICRQMQALKINEQIYGLGRDIFEQALAKENILLSKPEKERLLRQILTQILKDFSNDLREADER